MTAGTLTQQTKLSNTIKGRDICTQVWIRVWWYIYLDSTEEIFICRASYNGTKVNTEVQTPPEAQLKAEFSNSAKSSCSGAASLPRAARA